MTKNVSKIAHETLMNFEDFYGHTAEQLIGELQNIVDKKKYFHTSLSVEHDDYGQVQSVYLIGERYRTQEEIEDLEARHQLEKQLRVDRLKKELEDLAQ